MNQICEYVIVHSLGCLLFYKLLCLGTVPKDTDCDLDQGSPAQYQAMAYLELGHVEWLAGRLYCLHVCSSTCTSSGQLYTCVVVGQLRACILVHCSGSPVPLSSRSRATNLQRLRTADLDSQSAIVTGGHNSIG